VVVDADALNAMARIPDLARDLKASCVLTPHPGEFRRLADALNLDADPVAPSRRTAAAEALAQRVGCIVVLKGAGTVVSNGHDTWTCDAGHPCLATAGTGDVLAGLLGGLLAQWRAMSHAGTSIAPRARPSHPPAKPAFADAPGLAPVMSTDQLMALAAAKLGKAAPAAAPTAQAPSPAAPLTMLDVVKLGVLAHARAGEAWARARHASAGLLAEELADLIPPALEPLRA
jgi:NAD(P)H-hydrate repair Nnr-like enzyme with NAD(P)H-hydrate dehydratase domain